MKRILVYPCGTEIGLEIYRALNESIHYELVGGACGYDHGRFVYKNYIDDLPFITDLSTERDIIEFDKTIAKYEFDMIYPAMDGVVTIFSKYRNKLKPIVIAPNYETAQITRSKRLTYKVFENVIPIPKEYSMEDAEEEILSYPVFIKPDVGQGAIGTAKIYDINDLYMVKKKDDSQLILEYLPGTEYTIDCFTNANGKLVYCKGRSRKRIKNGISVNAVFVERPEFIEYAERINQKVKQKGGWFFQLKEAASGELKLLEIASRIAGTSAISRNIGVNLPLLTANIFNGIPCEDVIVNNYYIELDRALENRYHIDLEYDTVFIDYDDTIVKTGTVNLSVIKFLFQCMNKEKKIVLISKHDGNLQKELIKYKISELFDEVIHISRDIPKYKYITTKTAIFIDDSYGERREVFQKCGINVFDVNTLECLMEE